MTATEYDQDTAFDDWIDDLRINVAQGEFGYEPGELTIYPEMWRPMFDRGLTPSEAFRRALGDDDPKT